MTSHRDGGHRPTCARTSQPSQLQPRRSRQRQDVISNADPTANTKARTAAPGRPARTRPSRQGACCSQAGGACCKKAGGACCKKAASQQGQAGNEADRPTTACDARKGCGRNAPGDAPHGSRSRCSRGTAASGKHSDEALQRMGAVLRGADALDLRCPGCGSLMARTHGTSLVMQRGGVLALVEGDAEVTFVCYRRRCGLWTTVQTSDMKAEGETRAPV